MEDPELCQLLEQLHQEIEETKTVDERERALLRELSEDIRDLLERCETEETDDRPLTIRRLEEAIDSLAVNHPTLTAMLTNMSRILSNAGI